MLLPAPRITSHRSHSDTVRNNKSYIYFAWLAQDFTVNCSIHLYLCCIARMFLRLAWCWTTMMSTLLSTQALAVSSRLSPELRQAARPLNTQCNIHQNIYILPRKPMMICKTISPSNI